MNEVAAVPKAASNPIVLKEIKPSSRTGVETSMWVRNELDEKIELFWSDTQGELKSYGLVKKNETHQQHTYAGHVWVVKDSQGKVLQITEIPDSGTYLTFQPNQAEKRASAKSRR